MTLEEVREWIEEGHKVALYCAGTHGVHIKSLFHLCGIQVDCFLDNDVEKQGTWIDGVLCENPEHIACRNDYIIFICVAVEQYAGMLLKAEEQGLFNIKDFRLLVDDIIENHMDLFRLILKKQNNLPAADIFYTYIEPERINQPEPLFIGNNKIAVYTSVFGNYDVGEEPKAHPKNIDYYFVSDDKPEGLSVYQWIDAREIVPDTIRSPIKRNRFVKMHPHLIFPQYQYSIYIDGNIQIQEDISSFLCDSASGISVFAHTRRDCIYYEALTIVNYRRVQVLDVINQMSRYLEEKMPLHYGLPEMPVIARKHHHPACVQVMEIWWTEFEKESQRDQLSFMYAMWKNHMGMSDLAILGNNVRKQKKITFYEHNADSENIANEASK